MSARLRSVVFDLMRTHGGESLLQEFISHPPPPTHTANAKAETAHVSQVSPKATDSSGTGKIDSVDEPDVWSIEIGPREGICTFSKPLIIATETPISGRRLVRLAHFWADVWDITYDPILEFVDEAGRWSPVSIFQHHSGYKQVTSEEHAKELEKMCEEWADVLVERGYHLTDQAILRRLGARSLDSHL
ncbi:hypothetical protein DFJ73DRAFT_844544 [Zopfochytrium polystomum]|nr:hypothetical protein DFJ73DRAFT_844544 [Zopfochytrium polystomum]